MEKKKEETPKPNEPESAEVKSVEVVESKSLDGVEKKATHTLKSKQVFEPMQGIFKTIWEKE